MRSRCKGWLRRSGCGAIERGTRNAEVGTRNIRTGGRPACSAFRVPTSAFLSPAPRIQRLIRILPGQGEHADLNRADRFLQVRARVHIDVLEQVQDRKSVV